MLGETEGNSGGLGCSFRQWDLVVQTYKIEGITMGGSLQNWCRSRAILHGSSLKGLVAQVTSPAPSSLTLIISTSVYFTSPLFPFQSQLQTVLSLPLQPVFY